MSKRDEFFLALGKAGATQRQAQNIFYALDYAIQQDTDTSISINAIKAYARVNDLLARYGLMLSDYTPRTRVVEKESHEVSGISFREQSTHANISNECQHLQKINTARLTV